MNLKHLNDSEETVNANPLDNQNERLEVCAKEVLLTLLEKIMFGTMDLFWIRQHVPLIH